MAHVQWNRWSVDEVPVAERGRSDAAAAIVVAAAFVLLGVAIGANGRVALAVEQRSSNAKLLQIETLVLQRTPQASSMARGRLFASAPAALAAWYAFADVWQRLRASLSGIAGALRSPNACSFESFDVPCLV